MTRRNIIEYAARLGHEWQTKYPEIPELYRKGLSAKEIVQELNLQSGNCVNLSRRTCVSAVRYNLGGYRGSEGIKAYQGSMERQEYIILSKERRKCYRYDSEKRKEASKKGTIALGKTPWLKREDMEEQDPRHGELESLLELASLPEFQHSGRRIAGRPNYKALASRLNIIYPETPERTPKAIRCKLQKHTTFIN